MAEKWLAQQPGLTPVQQEFLEKALALYEEFADERADNPQVLLEAARARMKVAVIHYRLGRFDRAEAASQQVLRQLEDLVVRFPEEVECRKEFAVRLFNVSGLRIDQGRLAEAEASVSRAVRIAEDVVSRNPEDQHSQCDLAQFLQQRAQVLELLKRLDEAEAVARRSRDLFEEHQSAGYTGPVCRERFAAGEMVLGVILTKRQALTEAEAALARSQQLSEGFVADDPNDPDRRNKLCNTLVNLASAQSYAGRREEAVRTRRRAFQQLKTLADRFPGHPQYALGLMTCLEHDFRDLQATGSPGEAEKAGRRGLELAEQ